MAVEGLPEELMMLILAKLPVKSLLRCKCVQKSWYTLIKSPHFIRLHRSSSSSSSSPQLIVRHCIKPRHVLSFYSNETLDDLGNDIDVPISNCCFSRDLSGGCQAFFSGHCDGLVCITNHDDQIIIFNPALREFRSLFVPSSFDFRIKSVAFGSDPNTGEHKVLMIGVPCDNSSRHQEIQVYDFSTDSWRETTVVIRCPFHYSQQAVSLNGAFHWCPWEDSILTFGISNELIGSIPVPDFADVYCSKELSVSSKSQLSLILYESEEGRIEICVMTEYGVKESWTRLFQIKPLLDCYNPLAIWDEQQLLLQTEDGQLVSCDLQHPNHLRYFPIDGVSDVYPYFESLVSVNGIGESII